MRLLERELYLDVLNAGLESSAAGSGCVTLLCGEAGIGKSALLHEFVEQQRTAARVLWGGCEALFTPHPLAPLHDVARQLSAEFRRAIGAAAHRIEIFNATLDELARGPTPTILIFEDVHWADEPTLDLIKFLGRRLQRLSVLLIVSYREDEVGTHHPLRSVIGDLPVRWLRRLALPALSQAAVATLSGLSGRRLKDLYATTGGNPFFVTEALAMSGDAVPVTVRDAVMARLARLAPAARELANLVSVVPARIEKTLLDAVARVEPAALEECLGAGIVAHADGALSFRHELARRALEEALPVPLRQELHARVLSALLQQPQIDSLSARIVHHASRAGDSDAVLRIAPRAAQRAASLGAHREAAAHYSTALAHAAALPDQSRAEFLDAASYEYYLTAQMPEAIAAREQALALWRACGDGLKQGDCLRWLSRLYWHTGNNAAAERYASEAIATLEPLQAGAALAMAYSNRAQLLMLSDFVPGTLLWVDKALALAAQLGDSQIESHALNSRGVARLIREDPAGHADLERSLELAMKGGYHEQAARAFSNIASTAVRRHDFARADRCIEQGLAYTEQHDLGLSHRYLLAMRAESALAQGEWQRAADDAQMILRHPQLVSVTRMRALIVLARVRARRGDPEPQAPLDEARALAADTGELQRLAPVAAASAELAWLSGTPEVAAEELGRCCALALSREDIWATGELACWLARLGRLDTVPERVAEPYARQLAQDWAGAAEVWQRLGSPYQQADALLASGEQAAMHAALEIFERLGAAPMIGMARRRLRASGVRGVRRGAQQRTRQNPHGLTNRELHVLALLADGCRNAEIARRLFVADKTVDHHVSAVLAKLNVRSRVEAAALANQAAMRDSMERIRAGKR